MTRSFDVEQQIIGLMLSYPTDAARILLPHLGSDRFIYDINGMFGGDHQRIWQAVILTHSEGDAPSVSAVGRRLRDRNDLIPYLGAMTDMLKNRWRVREFETAGVLSLLDEVNKNGGLYRNMVVSRKLGDNLADPETFEKFVVKVPDVDDFMHSHIEKLYRRTQQRKSGYKFISETSGATREFLRRTYEGEQLVVIDCGMPSLRNIGIPRVENVIFVHGESGGGKSLFVNQVNLGVAINLYLNNIPGCVLVNSMEEGRNRIQLKWASILMGVDISPIFLGQKLTKQEYELLEKGLAFIDLLPIAVDHTATLDAQELGDNARLIHTGERGPIIQMSLDYIGLLKDKKRHESKEQVTAAIAEMRRDLTREFGCSAMDISQTTEAGNAFRIAGPDGARYSKAIRHAADNMIEVWNPLYMKEAGIIFKTPDNLNDWEFWVLLEKDKDAGLAKPIPFIWNAQHKSVLDKILNPDLARNKPRVFDFDLDIDRELGISEQVEEDYSWEEF